MSPRNRLHTLLPEKLAEIQRSPWQDPALFVTVAFAALLVTLLDMALQPDSDITNLPAAQPGRATCGGQSGANGTRCDIGAVEYAAYSIFVPIVVR